MPYQEFIPKRFNPKHAALIEVADQITRNYAAQGFDLSLRQLYYQFVAHHGLANTEQSYNMLGTVISEARLAGRLDWNAIDDRGRTTDSNNHWRSPADILEACAAQFRYDTWADQPWHLEVMVEKDALAGVLRPVCAQLDIAFSANKGYASSSHLYRVGKRLKAKMRQGKKIAILYLGDHDPSGIDMGRDVRDRLALFSGAGFWCDDEYEMQENGIDKPGVVVADEWLDDFKIDRLALNMPQVRQYNPPPNPAKMSDSRAHGYVRQFGYESWELDALDPETLAALVTNSVESYRDDELYEAALDRQMAARNKLSAFAGTVRMDELSEGGPQEDDEDED